MRSTKLFSSPRNLKFNEKYTSASFWWVILALVAFAVIDNGCSSGETASSNTLVRLFDSNEFANFGLENITKEKWVEDKELKLDSFRLINVQQRNGTKYRLFRYNDYSQMPQPSNISLVRVESNVNIPVCSSFEEIDRTLDYNFLIFQPDELMIQKVVPFNGNLELEIDPKIAAPDLTFFISEELNNQFNQGSLRLNLTVDCDGERVSSFIIDKQSSIHAFRLYRQAGKHTLKLSLSGSDISSESEIPFPDIRIDSIVMSYPGFHLLDKSGDPLDEMFQSIRVSYPYTTIARQHFLDWFKNQTGMLKRIYDSNVSPYSYISLKTGSLSDATYRSLPILGPMKYEAKTRIKVPFIFEVNYAIPYIFDNLPPATIHLTLKDPENGSVLAADEMLLSGAAKDTWHEISLKCEKATKSGEYIAEMELAGGYGMKYPVVIGEPVLRSLHIPDSIQTESQPNIILISADTLRADHLSCYGYERQTSPNIDALAKKGILFKNCFSTAHSTKPSHLSILTGYFTPLFDFINPVQDPWGTNSYVLPPNVPNLSWYMKQNGFFTIAFTGSGFLSAKFGQFNNFDSYNESEHGYSSTVSDQPKFINNAGFERPIQWLRSKPSSKFFMFLHTYTTHAPYVSPESYGHFFPDFPLQNISIKTLRNFIGKATSKDVEKATVAYDRGIRYLDDNIGKLIKTLEDSDLLNNTLIIFTSDHGDELYEHKSFEHVTMFDENLHIPLIFFWKDKFQPRIVSENVQTVDIVPTILDILGNSHNQLHGLSLLNLINDRPGYPSDRLIFGSVRDWHIIKKGDVKLHFSIMNRFQYGINTPFFAYKIDIDRREQNMLLNLDKYDELKMSLLFYIAQNYRGWNILINNDNNDEYVIKSDNFKPGNMESTVDELFSTQNEELDMYFNRAHISSSKRFILLMLNTDDNIDVNIFKKVNGSDELVPVDNIKFGVTGNRKVKSPMILNNDIAERVGTSTILNDEYHSSLANSDGAIVWYTDIPKEYLKMFENVKIKLSEQEMNELRNLGYLN